MNYSWCLIGNFMQFLNMLEICVFGALESKNYGILTKTPFFSEKHKKMEISY